MFSIGMIKKVQNYQIKEMFENERCFAEIFQNSKKLSFSLNRTLISDLKDQYQDDITTDLDMPSKAKEDISEFIPEFQLKRDNALTTLSSVEKEYFVSFDLWITELTPGWKNVLHLTTGDNNRRYGSFT